MNEEKEDKLAHRDLREPLAVRDPQVYLESLEKLDHQGRVEWMELQEQGVNVARKEIVDLQVLLVPLETLVSQEYLVLMANLEREVFKAHLAQLVPLVWLVYQDNKDGEVPLEQRVQREMVDLLENGEQMGRMESRDKMECQDLLVLQAHQEKRVKMV